MQFSCNNLFSCSGFAGYKNCRINWCYLDYQVFNLIHSLTRTQDDARFSFFSTVIIELLFILLCTFEVSIKLLLGGIEDLFNQLAGGRRSFSKSPRSQNQSLLNTIESKKETILIFDLSGKKIISVKIQDNIETDEYGEQLATGEKILAIKFENEEVLKYGIPKQLSKRKISHTFKNGILEVFLKK